MKPHSWSAIFSSAASKDPEHSNSSVVPEDSSAVQSSRDHTLTQAHAPSVHAPSAHAPSAHAPSTDRLKFWTPAKQISLLACLLGSAVTFPLLTPLMTATVQSYTLPVRVDRWLELRSINGVVNFYQNGQVQSASTDSTRLENVGDRLTTGADSSATLAVDTGIGFVMLAENTDLAVDELSVTASGGRVTRLNISRGQARLQVRPFLNPESELEIRTPAGVSGVRGTAFGIGITPSGQTGVATTEGEVEAIAQGEAVSINPGFQSLIVPGQPPTPPSPITDNVDIDITRLYSIDSNWVRVAGRIDPFSALTIEGELQDVTPEGWFSVLVARPDNRRIPVTVSTLSGKSKDYELAVP